MSKGFSNPTSSSFYPTFISLQFFLSRFPLIFLRILVLVSWSLMPWLFKAIEDLSLSQMIHYSFILQITLGRSWLLMPSMEKTLILGRGLFLRALSSKNKIGFVDGKVPQPAADSPLLPYWQRCNDLVASWILNSLHKDIAGSILYCNTAAEMWQELGERFGQSNQAKLFQVKKELSAISQGDSDIASYYTRAKKIWDEFALVDDMPKCTCKKCECGINAALGKYTQRQNLIHFLMGLNDTYTSVRGSLLMLDPLPSLDQTYSLLI